MPFCLYCQQLFESEKAENYFCSNSCRAADRTERKRAEDLKEFRKEEGLPVGESGKIQCCQCDEFFTSPDPKLIRRCDQCKTETDASIIPGQLSRLLGSARRPPHKYSSRQRYVVFPEDNEMFVRTYITGGHANGC